jgi:hypothetical protein
MKNKKLSENKLSSMDEIKKKILIKIVRKTIF